MTEVTQASDIYSNISKNDRLGLISKDGIDYKGIVNFLEFDESIVSKVAGVSRSKVRYDVKRMPIEVKTRLEEILNILNLVADHFNSIEKTSLWFKTPNPFFGEISPRDMIRFGRYAKLMQFIIDARMAQAKK